MLELGSALYLYPLVVQGKPTSFTTIPAFFPVIFELTVLFSAFGAVFGMLAMNLLPRWNHPLFNWDRFGKATDDGFFLVVEASDARFTEKDTQAFLEKVGGTLVYDITLVYCHPDAVSLRAEPKDLPAIGRHRCLPTGGRKVPTLHSAQDEIFFQ